MNRIHSHPQGFKAFCSAVEAKTGIIVRPEQAESVQNSVGQLIEEAGFDGWDDFLRAFDEDSDLYHKVLERVAIGETYFFRERKHFEFIAEVVIPELHRQRGPESTLRAWSAACASGAEAYSLAILCDELSQPATILGTDVAPGQIESARLGQYRPWAFRGDAMRHAAPYLQRDNGRFVLKDSIRNRVRFEQFNLTADRYPDPARGIDRFDLIFCRNVLIYFGLETARGVLRRLGSCLAPGGWLITGSGDPILDSIDSVDCVINDFGSFYRGKPRPPTPRPFAPGPFADSPTEFDEPTRPVRHAAKTVQSDPVARSDRAPASRRTVDQADAALKSGDASSAFTLASQCPTEAWACEIQVRAAIQLDANSDRALELCDTAITKFPLATSLHFLRGQLLMDRGEASGAFQALQRVLFLDRSAVMGHFLMGKIQLQRGQLVSANRHFRNVCQLCSHYQPGDVVPMSDGMTASQLLAAAKMHLTSSPS